MASYCNCYGGWELVEFEKWYDLKQSSRATTSLKFIKDSPTVPLSVAPRRAHRNIDEFRQKHIE